MLFNLGGTAYWKDIQTREDTGPTDGRDPDSHRMAWLAPNCSTSRVEHGASASLDCGRENAVTDQEAPAGKPPNAEWIHEPVSRELEIKRTWMVLRYIDRMKSSTRMRCPHAPIKFDVTNRQSSSPPRKRAASCIFCYCAISNLEASWSLSF